MKKHGLSKDDGEVIIANNVENLELRCDNCGNIIPVAKNCFSYYKLKSTSVLLEDSREFIDSEAHFVTSELCEDCSKKLDKIIDSFLE